MHAIWDNAELREYQLSNVAVRHFGTVSIQQKCIGKCNSMYVYDKKWVFLIRIGVKIYFLFQIYLFAFFKGNIVAPFILYTAGIGF